MFIFKFIKKYFLLIIILLALVLRIYNIESVPYELDGDEAAFGYYGYSLIQNLSDEYGNKLPLYFPSIGDYKFPVYAYLSSIPVFVFGLNELSARFISALAGTLSVFVGYLFTKRLTENKAFPYLTAILLAINPYSIIFSRGAYESNLAVFFVFLGIYLFYFYKKKNIKFLIFSFLLLLIAFYTYSASRVFVILFLPSLYITRWLFEKYRPNKREIIFLIIVLLVAFSSFIDPRSRVRANDIGFLSDNSYAQLQSEYILEDGLAENSVKETLLYHNKKVMFVQNFLSRYLSHFSPEYLFISSNANMPKYSVRGIGLFYYFEILTIFLGIASLYKYKKLQSFIVPWIVIAPVASSLTIETPNPIRSLMLFPGLVILSAIGFYEFYLFLSKKVGKFSTIGLATVIVAGHLSFFLHQYFVHDIYFRPWYTDGGTKEMVTSVWEMKNEFEFVAVPDDPYIFFLFYNKISTKDFLARAEIEDKKLGEWESVNSLDNIIFKMPVNCPKIGKINVLYVCKGQDIPQNSILHKTIRFPDSVVAYNLVEFIPYSEVTYQKLPDGVHYMVETDLSFEEAILPNDEERLW